jgi:Ca2+-binding EF-hand superfamily protein
VLAAFRIFDRDNSGALSADELIFCVSQIPGIGKVRSRQLWETI